MFAFVDRLSELFGRVAAWLFFIIGGMIVFEVVARYVFLSPTIWAEEMSRFAQIWATYLAAAYVLKNRHLIRIDIASRKLGPRARVVAELFTLSIIAVFCVVAIIYGIEIVADSIVQGRATPTMLSVPMWITESAIPVGAALLLAQALVEAARLRVTGTRKDGAPTP